jgi:hypothetical protein
MCMGISFIWQFARVYKYILTVETIIGKSWGVFCNSFISCDLNFSRHSRKGGGGGGTGNYGDTIF